MAKRRGRKRAAVKRAAHRVGRRLSAAAATRPGKVLMAAGVAAAGGIATSFAINNIPKVKDLSPTMKALAQIGAGAAAVLFLRNKWVKGLGAGSVVAGVFGLSKSALNLNPLAGPSAGGNTLSEATMRRLINRGMNVPANVRLNIPARVAMRGPSVMGDRGAGFGGVAIG